MKILAIETSCDDTGIAILSAPDGPHQAGEDNFVVLANVIASQIKVHQKYGGVYPAMAKREHQKNLVPTFVKALSESKLLKNLSVNFAAAKNMDIAKILEREPELYKKLVSFLKKYGKPDVDLIAVTNGPGLEPCLWVGVNFAKALSYAWGIPVVPVNHIEGHILVNFLQTTNYKLQTKFFPAISLVVSGGHTQIILVKGVGKYKVLGETRDDAAGECFDKCAKILGLGYPGGPIIAKLALQLPTTHYQLPTKLPRPMMHTKDYDFSFSGLKTAVLYADRKVVNKTKKYKTAMAIEIQQAIIDVLIKKTMKAVKDYNAKTLILGGGVSANQELRKQFADKLQWPKGHPNYKLSLLVPPANLSTDNGLMIAIAGFYHKKNTKDWQKINANGNLRISE